MILAFKDRALREVCENDKVAVETYGDTVSNFLKIRLSDLEAAENIFDVTIGEPRALDELGVNYQIDIDDTNSIVFCQNHPDISKDEKINWTNVYRIKILNIINKYE